MCVFMSDKPFDAEACDIGGHASATNGLSDMKTPSKTHRVIDPLLSSLLHIQKRRTLRSLAPPFAHDTQRKTLCGKKALAYCDRIYYLLPMQSVWVSVPLPAPHLILWIAINFANVYKSSAFVFSFFFFFFRPFFFSLSLSLFLFLSLSLSLSSIHPSKQPEDILPLCCHPEAGS
jgi:hypothetical protein